MKDHNYMGETPYDLIKSSIAPYKTLQNVIYWDNWSSSRREDCYLSKHDHIQSSPRIQYVSPTSRTWSRSSRIPSTWNLSFRTWFKRRRWIRHEQHRDVRVLQKLFQKVMSQFQFLLGNRLYFEVVENFKVFAEDKKFREKTTTFRHSLFVLLRRMTVAVSHMDRLKKYC